MTVWLALRYVRPRRNFITVISLLSVTGIIIGSAALIIVMSIFNGFRDVATQLMTHFGPHAKIVPTSSALILNVDSIIAQLPSYATGVPIVESSIVVQHRTTTGVALALGIQPTDAPQMVGVRSSVVIGAFVPVVFDNIAGAVIGAGLADRLNIFPGDTVVVYSPAQIERALTSLVRPAGKRVVIRGVFQSNASRDADDTWFVTDATTISSITGIASPTSIDVMLADPAAIDPFLHDVKGALGSAARVQSWKELNSGLYDTMRLERMGSFVVLMLIIVVAVFNVLVSLTLGVTEKHRSIAVLRTIGASASLIRNTWIVQGLILGVGATTIGCGIGSALAWSQEHWGWLHLSGGSFLVPIMPVSLHWQDVAVTAIVSIVLTSMASIYPARRAASLRIADAIRIE